MQEALIDRDRGFSQSRKSDNTLVVVFFVAAGNVFLCDI